MIIADTSIWIEYLKDNKEISSLFDEKLKYQNVIAIGCVFGELLQGTKNKRETNIISEYWKNLPKIEEKNLWIEAGILSAQNKYFAKGIGLIDTFIIASAKKSKAKIWTLDKKLRTILNTNELFG